MEPSGRNRWQPVANETRPETAQASETVAVGCDRLPPRPHGKEGVDGSSPSEGSAKAPQIGAFSFDEDLQELQYAVPAEPFYGAFRFRAQALKRRKWTYSPAWASTMPSLRSPLTKRIECVLEDRARSAASRQGTALVLVREQGPGLSSAQG
jgi:hypothetical protein